MKKSNREIYVGVKACAESVKGFSERCSQAKTPPAKLPTCKNERPEELSIPKATAKESC